MPERPVTGGILRGELNRFGLKRYLILTWDAVDDSLNLLRGVV